MLLGCAPALADSYYENSDMDVFSENSTRDGFSFAYSQTDPSGGGGYKAYGAPKAGSKVFGNAIATLLVSEIAAGLIALIPISGVASEVAARVLSIFISISSTSPYVYYDLSIAYHNVLPGFYQKLKYDWYADADHTIYITTTYLYRFKA